MNPLARLAREPNLITGLVVAGIGLAVAFGVHITDVQTAALLLFLGAVIALIRFLTTPTAEVVAHTDDNGGAVAGPASPITDGAPVVVKPKPEYGHGEPDQY